MKKIMLLTIAIFAGIALIASACGSDDDDNGDNAATETGGFLKTVQDRDELVCGVRDDFPGFASIDSSGRNVGFDVDFCRVIAAAVLGDADKVDFKLLETSQRFTALQSREIDVLVRNTTWTATRDGDEAANFVFTTYYDGQGFMAPAASGLEELSDLANANICVASGTTTETNLARVLGQRGIPFNPNTFSSAGEIQSAYEAGQCEAWTADTSQLVAFKNTIEDGGGGEQFIFPDVISKEPLGPAVLDGDTEWAQVVRWAVMVTVQAWEFGITSDNVASMRNQDEFASFFNVGQNPGLGLDDDFTYNVISQVGNYKEIYDQNLAQLGVPLAGSVNDLWINGGLLYTPPYR